MGDGSTRKYAKKACILPTTIQMQSSTLPLILAQALMMPRLYSNRFSSIQPTKNTHTHTLAFPVLFRFFCKQATVPCHFVGLHTRPAHFLGWDLDQRPPMHHISLATALRDWWLHSFAANRLLMSQVTSNQKMASSTFAASHNAFAKSWNTI